MTVVTPDPAIGRAILRTAADLPLRQKLKSLGVKTILKSAVQEWHGDGATIIDLLDGERQRLAFNSLVLATVNIPDTTLVEALRGSGIEVHAIGDAVATRHAPAAIYEGRRLGLAL